MKQLSQNELIEQLKEATRKMEEASTQKAFDLYCHPEIAAVIKQNCPWGISRIIANPYIDKNTAVLCPHGSHPITLPPPPKDPPRIPRLAFMIPAKQAHGFTSNLRGAAEENHTARPHL